MQARSISIAPACRRMRHRREVPNRPPPGSGGRHGFALITVIWGLGLLTLLGAAVIVGARYRARAALADGSVLSSAAAAESAVNFAIASILSPTPNTSFPKKCRMPGGEQAEIVVEEEAGKIDINAAGLPTLERFFVGIAQDKSLGSKIAQNAVNFRKSLQRREPSNQTHLRQPDCISECANDVKSSGFSTILELDQIDGMSPALLRSAMRYTTTLSGRVEPMPEAMTPALRLLMGLDPGRAERRTPDTARELHHSDRHPRDRRVKVHSGGSRVVWSGLRSTLHHPRMASWRHRRAASASQLPNSGPVQTCFKP